MDEKQFSELVRSRFPELNEKNAAQAAKFRTLLLEENEKQNLTRLTEPEDFVEGHLEDVLALEKSGLLKDRNLDLGSGGGVPGLLSAALFPRKWILTDSEGRKAEFLSRAAQDLGLSEHVKAYGERAEKVLLGVKVDTVVARAVGPVERILGWIGKCSTWNTLILFKGPSWNAEWESFVKSGKARKYQIRSEYPYTVGSHEKKQRVLVAVERVPRGTSK